MERPADNHDIAARLAVVWRVAEERPSHSRQIHTNVPEQLPILPSESDLVLQHLGSALAEIFNP